MKFRFTIGRKIGTGFGVFILLTVIVFILTNNILNKESVLDEENTTVNNPTERDLNRLREEIIKSRELIVHWGTVQSIPTDINKVTLKDLMDNVVPETRTSLDSLQAKWNDDTQKADLDTIFNDIDKLFGTYDELKALLPDFDSYLDPTVRFMANEMVDKDGGEIHRQSNLVLQKLDKLIVARQASSDVLRGEMEEARSLLQTLMRYLGLALVIGGILIAIFTVRSIVSPIHRLRDILLSLGKGMFPKKTMEPRGDEIGEMSEALNTLIDGLRRTTEFSKEVGSGNFDFQHQPLSQDDVLGHALLKMRDDLAENERMLELKVKQRTEEVVKKAEEIEQQKEKIEELYKDVTDSIRYAKRLQESILPSESMIKAMLPKSFVLYRPKDIVSGDFYWFEKTNNKVLFAAVDCTGHGVPGAFMSLVGHQGLNAAVKEHELDEPAKILHDLDQMATETLNQNVGESNVRDGMDLALCSLDTANMKLEYAGAYNPLYIIRDGELLQTKADKHAIGGRSLRKEKKYTNHTFDLQPNDVIYIFSDGYADQFGGSKGKKFMYKQFRDLLLDIHQKPLEDQKRLLNETIESWRGTFEQVDDILVIGVRV